MNDTLIKELKDLRMAYLLSDEYDHIPEIDAYELAKKLFGEFDSNILEVFEGMSTSDILDILWRKIERLR